MRRKIYSIVLLAVGLLIGTNVFGAKGQGHSEPQVGDVAKVSIDVTGVITTTYYATLQDAFDDLPDNSYPTTITMLADVQTTDACFKIQKYNNVTLDLNGKMISASQTLAKGQCVIQNLGTLTITDNSAGANGIITSTAEKPDAHEYTYYPTYASNTITNSGTIYMKAGRVVNAGTEAGAAQYAIDNTGVVIMDGGTLQGRVPVRMVCNNGKTIRVEINGGEIDANGALAIWAQIYNGGVADVIVNDGTLKSKGNSIMLDDAGNNGTARAKVHINGGTLYGDCLINATTEDCEITGGTFMQGTLKCSEEYPHKQIMTGGIFIGVSKEDVPIYKYVAWDNQNDVIGKTTAEATQQNLISNIVEDGDKWIFKIGETHAFDEASFPKSEYPTIEDVKKLFTDGVLVVVDYHYYSASFSLGKYWALVKPAGSNPSDYQNLKDDAFEYIAAGFTAQEYNGNGHPEADLMITTTSTKETDSNGSWTTPETWLPLNAPDAATDVTIKNEIIVANGTAVAHGMEINGEGQIIVKKGAVLEIGAAGIKTNNHDVQPIIVEAGGTLRVGVGGVSKEAGTLNPVEIYNDGTNSGAFMINPNAQVNTMPEATITLTTNVRKGYWQHLALPIENLTEHSNDKGAANAVFEWKDNHWNQLGGWDKIEAFKGYDFTNNYEGEGKVTYTFKGQLVGIQNQGLRLIEGVNFFGNSYTAPISLSALFDQIGSDMAANTIEKTVYIYNSSTLSYGFTSKLGIELAEMGYADLDFKTIAPLQGFWMNLQEGKVSAGTTINYAKAVWNNTEELGKPQYAPSRKSSNNNFSTVATISVTAANGAADKVILVEGEEFSSEFENGSDASKMMSEESFNLFVTTEDGNQSMVATDNLEGTILSFQAADAINYTLRFSHIHGNDYAIRDLKTGVIIPVTENGSYDFIAQPNSVEKRFEMIVRRVTTDNQEIVATPVAKGIYNVAGQYMGDANNWNNIPNGVYIVDGVKIIK